MKLFTRCFVLVLPILAGCKGQLASITVNLSADGSGEVSVAGVRDVRHRADQDGNPDGILQGTKDAQAIDLEVRQTSAKFAAIKDLKIGDVTFSTEVQEGKNLLVVHIPASASAKWFGAFGVSERSLELWNKMEEEAKKADEARRKKNPKAAPASLQPTKPPNVLFEINLPGKLEGQGFETVPLGLMTKIGVDRGERMASLSIPLAEIHGGKLKEVVWKVSYAQE